MSRKPSLHQIAEALLGLLDKGMSMAKVARTAAAYLVSEQRAKECDALMHHLVSLRAERGDVEVLATSAFDLSDETKRHIKQLMVSQYDGSPRIHLQTRHNEGVVGGMRLEAPDVLLDITIKQRLKHLAAAINTT